MKRQISVFVSQKSWGTHGNSRFHGSSPLSPLQIAMKLDPFGSEKYTDTATGKEPARDSRMQRLPLFDLLDHPSPGIMVYFRGIIPNGRTIQIRVKYYNLPRCMFIMI